MKTKKILLDLQCLQGPSKDSRLTIGYRSLMKLLIEVNPDFELSVLLNGNLKQEVCELRQELSGLIEKDNFNYFYTRGDISFNSNPEILQEAKLTYAALVNHLSPDILLAPSIFERHDFEYITPLSLISPKIKIVTVVHDLIFLQELQDCLSNDKSKELCNNLLLDFGRIDLILTFSETVKNSCLSYFPNKSVSNISFCSVFRKEKVLKQLADSLHSILPKNEIENSKESIEKTIDKLCKQLADIKRSEDQRRELADALEATFYRSRPEVNFQFPKNPAQIEQQNLKWRIEGQFDSSYSLCIVNRYLALGAKDAGIDVTLYSTDREGDKKPNPKFLKENPQIAFLYNKAIEEFSNPPDLCSRNIYPPNVDGMNGKLNFLHCYGWEESAYPQDKILEFNEKLNALSVTSDFVKKVFQDSGLTLPIVVSGNGIDHWKNYPVNEFTLKTNKKFKFLHISSCFPRKGILELLIAYNRYFGADDDICLVVKTFPNPHNEIEDWIEQARKISKKTSFPEIEVINKDLSEGEIKSIVRQCDALINPSKGEGFCMPLAEGMLESKPAITTNWSGQTYFCNPKDSWLIDYKLSPAKSHLKIPDSFWAEPSIEDIGKRLLEVFNSNKQQLSTRTRAAFELINEKFKWKDVASKTVSQLLERVNKPKVIPKIAWLTTWNTRCGIATYSEQLLKFSPFPLKIIGPMNQEHPLTEENVVRLWEIGDIYNEDFLDYLKKENFNTVVFQYNFGFGSSSALSQFLLECKRLRISTFLTLHATYLKANLEEMKPGLASCKRLFVHTLEDVNRLKDVGLVEQVTLLPHGVKVMGIERTPEKFRIGSYGFFLPHKGFKILIEAVAILRNKYKLPATLRLVTAEYPKEESVNDIREAKKLIKRLGLEEFVELHTDFLSDEESLGLLESCEVLVFPYQFTGESASGAVRVGISSQVPVFVTPLEIFNDVRPAVSEMKGFDAETIAEELKDFFSERNSSKREQMKLQTLHWIDDHSYEKISNRLFSIIYSTINDR